MNPNATEFQSLIYSQQGDEADPSNKSSGDAFQGIQFGLLVIYQSWAHVQCTGAKVIHTA